MFDWLDKKLNRFKGISFIAVMLFVVSGYFIAISSSLTPAILLFSKGLEYSESWSLVSRSFFLASLFGVSYLSFAVSLIFIVPVLNFIMPFRLQSWRGRYYSLHVIPWYYHNALVQLVRYTVLDIMTPSPLNVLFYKMMGMKMGRNCIINTTNISDPCMIELGDNVTIGGSATIFAHYAQGGFIVIAPVKIGDGATIGLKASIMGDVVIGERVLVKPHAVVLPKTRMFKETNLDKSA